MLRSIRFFSLNIKHCFGWLLPLALLANSCLLPAALAPVATDSGVKLDVLGHVGGAALTVALRDHYALLGLSYELIVLDLADPARPQWVAALPIPTNDIALAGRYAYVVGRDSFAVVDIADPAHPVLVNALALPDTGSVVVVATGYAYVAVYGDLYTIALANPTKPAIIGVNHLTVRITGMAMAANELYVVSDNGFHRLDISAPTQPIVLEMLVDPRLSYGPVIVIDDYAYLAVGKEGLAVVNVSDPTAPRLVSRYDTPGEARDLAVQWPYLLVADGDSGLRVLDIRDPLHLIEVASHQSCDGAYGVVSVDGAIYVMQPLGGLWSLRLIDHEPPEEAP